MMEHEKATNIIQPTFPDYPAAHSMDTTWFAVDENGEIGKFETGGCGSAPLLEGMEPPSIEDKLRSQYTKAYDYAEQYMAVEKYLRELGYDDYDEIKHRKVMPVHEYEPEDESNGLYYWDASPEQIITWDSLPERLQSGRHLLYLKDYDFRSREPIDPYEYVNRCYADWTRLKHIYPQSYYQTYFPILNADGSWTPDFFEECYDDSGLFSGQGFFALDDAGYLALFRTDRFGAIPLERFQGQPSTLRNDMDTWEQLIKKKHPALAEQMEKAERMWQAQGPRHWLEYPLGSASPRLYGLYHYDASWHHPMPYLRIGVPQEVQRFDRFPGELQELMKPIRLPGIRFAEAPRVQPFELVPSYSCSSDYYDQNYGWDQPQVWIDAALEHVHPCHEFSVFTGSTELLLRRARRHCRRVESLARP